MPANSSFPSTNSPPPSATPSSPPPTQSLFGRALSLVGLSSQSPSSAPQPNSPADAPPPQSYSPPPPQSYSPPPPPPPASHPTLDIPDAVWENPYHPLPGPPQTPQERNQLQQIIQQERSALGSAVARKQTTRQLSLTQAAKLNCADYDFVYTQCMLMGPWFERMRLCPEQKRGLQKCVEIQKQNLQLLGYNKDSLTARERAIIADEADQAYLQAMKAAEAEGVEGS
ncbi:hypothetical protein HDU86_000985 [Geranomyces michiganensis]|nr:hypothetical protein HDU86_000985 [Geranomyces michiganensis]